jgi:hypothetical protein
MKVPAKDGIVFLVSFVPNTLQMNNYDQFQNCIDACLKCASVCNYCATSCTREDDVQMMAKCIRLDMECAAICYATAQLLSMGGTKAKEVCMLCADICEACADECSQHHNDHCRMCAETCRKCANECRKTIYHNPVTLQ